MGSIETNAGSIVERAFDPARFIEVALRTADEQLVELYQQTRRIGGVIWMSTAICCGVAMERGETRASPGSPFSIDALARAFETHTSEISRLAKIYRLLLVPRVAEQGANATFPIRQRRYYELAGDAATYAGQPATEILAMAEDRLAVGRFTAREFKALLLKKKWLPDNGKGTPDSSVPRVLAHLKALSLVPPDIAAAAIRKMCKGKADEWLDHSAAVGRLLDLIDRDLSAYLEEAEERRTTTAAAAAS
jgi:hypothetical protein